MATTTRNEAKSSPLLSWAIRGNAWFSFLTGGILLVGAPWLTDVLGPTAWSLAGVGSGVLAFGLSLRRGLAKDPVATGRFAVIADVAWVLATVALAPIVAGSFTAVGAWVAVTIAIIVADFAILQWVGVRRALA